MKVSTSDLPLALIRRKAWGLVLKEHKEASESPSLRLPPLPLTNMPGILPRPDLLQSMVASESYKIAPAGIEGETVRVLEVTAPTVEGSAGPVDNLEPLLEAR